MAVVVEGRGGSAVVGYDRIKLGTAAQQDPHLADARTMRYSSWLGFPKKEYAMLKVKGVIYR